MIQEDPSERFLRDRLTPIADTPERYYLYDETHKIIVASWKPGRADQYDMERYQVNAMTLADLIKTWRPNHIMVDCRHLGFELSDQDIRWYVAQTKSLWAKSSIQKMAFVFRTNLAVQMSMEALKDVAQEEGIKHYEHRIFECNVEAANWLKGSK